METQKPSFILNWCCYSVPKKIFKTLLRLLKDITRNHESLFGGKTGMVFSELLNNDGSVKEQDMILPKIILTPAEGYPFIFKWNQDPIILAYSGTFNKVPRMHFRKLWYRLHWTMLLSWSALCSAFKRKEFWQNHSHPSRGKDKGKNFSMKIHTAARQGPDKQQHRYHLWPNPHDWRLSICRPNYANALP